MWAQGNGEKTRDEGLFVLFVFFSKSVNFFLQFRRLFITDHCGPSVTAIDDYLALLREFLPRNAFFAINCHGGDGRCTTSIVMMDIAFNATKVKTSRIFPALFLFFPWTKRSRSRIFLHETSYCTITTWKRFPRRNSSASMPSTDSPS